MSLRDVAGSHVREHDQGEDATALGDEAIIGQTALGKWDPFVDRINQRLVPNPAHPEQPASKVG